MNSLSKTTSAFTVQASELINALERDDLLQYSIYGEGERNILSNNIVFSMGMGTMITDDLPIPITISNLKIKKLILIIDNLENIDDSFCLTSKNESSYINNGEDLIFDIKDGNVEIEQDNVNILKVTNNNYNIITFNLINPMEVSTSIKLTSISRTITNDVRIRFSILLVKQFMNLEQGSIFKSIY